MLRQALHSCLLCNQSTERPQPLRLSAPATSSTAEISEAHSNAVASRNMILAKVSRKAFYLWQVSILHEITHDGKATDLKCNNPHKKCFPHLMCIFSHFCLVLKQKIFLKFALHSRH